MSRILSLMCGVALLVAGGTEPVVAGVQRLHYSGQLLQRDATGTEVPVRAFTMTAWLNSAGATSELLYRVEDEGRGGLEWWERTGRQTRSADGQVQGLAPRLRHVHLNRPYTFALPGPWLAHEGALERGREWTTEWEGRGVEYAVTGPVRYRDRDCWDITGTGQAGRSQTLRVEQATSLLVSITQRVFIGQGERFELQLVLEEQVALTDEAAAREQRVGQTLLRMQSEMGLGSETVATQLTPAQIAQVEAALPGLQADAAGTPWEGFVKSLAAANSSDRSRTDSLQALAARHLGKPAPDLTLTGVDGRPISTRPADTLLVLHFWDYRGSPESPFGQVGYLDFLANRWKGANVQVCGVAVDERLADQAQVRQVRRDVQKFTTEFMRLGYPVALDDGSLLSRFGDPRTLGAPLPLWVVIGRDGTVAHYRTGLYAIDPNRGLEELRETVTKLLPTAP